ncbi:MAG: T9SS type A sorting domain-containing protein [Candidatus Delongbacteria bacterium]|nr:T9SS type A sorting domain-containing protein [Candidatus Delongbacteria bacterium]
MRIRCLYAFVFFALGLQLDVMGQGTTFGGERNDIPTSIAITENDNLILAGFSKSFGDGSDQIFILECSKNGYLIWSKTLGNIYGDRPFDICVNSDNSICLTGESWLGFGGQNGRENMFLVHLDQFGNLLNQKSYDHFHRDMGLSVKETKDGGYIVVGFTKSNDDKYGEIMLVRVNENLEVVFERVLGEENSVDYGFDIIENESGYLVIGAIGGFFNSVQEDYRTELSKMYIAQLSPSGQLIWEKKYGGKGHDWVEQGLIINNDIYMVGATQSIGNGSFDLALFKINDIGDSLWLKTFGQSYYEQGRCIVYKDNKLYLGGQKRSDINKKNSAIYLVCTDLDGTALWEKTIETDKSCKLKDMVLSQDGQSLFCLAQLEDENTQIDYWFFTLNSSGNFISISDLNQIQNQVYPNPVAGQASIKISEEENSKGELFIYNQNGQLVQRIENEISAQIFNFSAIELIPGFYTYLLNLGKGEVIMGKFIVY